MKCGVSHVGGSGQYRLPEIGAAAQVRVPIVVAAVQVGVIPVDGPRKISVGVGRMEGKREYFIRVSSEMLFVLVFFRRPYGYMPKQLGLYMG